MYHEEIEISRREFSKIIKNLKDNIYYKKIENKPDKYGLLDNQINKSESDVIFESLIKSNLNFKISKNDDLPIHVEIYFNKIIFYFSIYSLEDEWFYIDSSFSKYHENFNFICDQLQGVKKIIDDIVKILEIFAIGRRISKVQESNSSKIKKEDYYIELTNNYIKFFSKYKIEKFEQKEIDKILTKLEEVAEKRYAYSLSKVEVEGDLLTIYFAFYRYVTFKIEALKFEDEWFRVLVNGNGVFNIFDWYRCDGIDGLIMLIGDIFKIYNIDIEVSESVKLNELEEAYLCLKNLNNSKNLFKRVKMEESNNFRHKIINIQNIDRIFSIIKKTEPAVESKSVFFYRNSYPHYFRIRYGNLYIDIKEREDDWFEVIISNPNSFKIRYICDQEFGLYSLLDTIKNSMKSFDI